MWTCVLRVPAALMTVHQPAASPGGSCLCGQTRCKASSCQTRPAHTRPQMTRRQSHFGYWSLRTGIAPACAIGDCSGYPKGCHVLIVVCVSLNHTAAMMLAVSRYGWATAKPTHKASFRICRGACSFASTHKYSGYTTILLYTWIYRLWSRRMDLHHRPPGYEPGKLLLLYAAVFALPVLEICTRIPTRHEVDFRNRQSA